MMRRLLILAALALAPAFISCEGGGNSGSETTNGLTGTVKDVEGRPIAGARILVLPEEFNPAEDDTGKGLQETRTNAKGVYHMTNVESGTYNLEVSDSVHGTLCLIQEVAVSAEAGLRTVDGVLGTPGSLDVRIADFLGAGESGYVYIPGTTELRRVDASSRDSGSVTLPEVPVGRFDRLLLVIDGETDKRVITLARNFEVLAESAVTTAAFQTWTHSRKIPVNTVDLGVAGAVTDFPLLVRLNAAGFDFTQAQPNGQDIRFSKADGTPIAFQIERWDAQTKRAEIWARLDSVAGGDAGQYINMHWGRSLAVAGASGPVFAGSAGFATVYHLDESANDDVGGYKDATPFANHATAAGINANSQVPGVIAGAKAFAGKPLSTLGVLTAALPPGFAGNPSFTVSFWMKYDTTATRQTILDFGTMATLKDMHFLLRRDSTAQFGPFDRELSSGSDPAGWQNAFMLGSKVGLWCHVATVYDAASGLLTTYIDGVKTSQVPCPPMSFGAGDALRIGQAISTHPLDHPFNGALDEIRFCTRALSAGRIKLDYETQKP